MPNKIIKRIKKITENPYLNIGVGIIFFGPVSLKQ